MARILFAWELGAQSGHLQRMAPPARALAERGHEIFFALRNLDRAPTVLQGIPATLLPAPAHRGATGPFYKPTFTYAHVLFNVGYSRGETLTGLAAGWRGLFQLVQPDLLICDHSPTALLAARGCGFPRATLGSSFDSPPDAAPLPNLLPEREVDADRLQAVEADVVRNINAALHSIHQPPVNRLLDLYYPGDAQFLLTHPELDVYPERIGGDYYGAWHTGSGEPFEWPPGRGPRIFAYLHPFPGDAEAVRQLAKLGWPTVLVHSNLTAELRKVAAAGSVLCLDRPARMSQVAAEADLGVTHASEGTSTQLLLAGKPVIGLPQQLEQTLFGRTLERLGVGRILTGSDGASRLGGEILRIVAEGTCREQAQTFASRYSGFDERASLQRLVDRCEDLIRLRD